MNEVNPYAPPKAQVVDYVAPAVADLAGRGERLGAAILDSLIGLLWVVPIWMFLGIFSAIRGGHQPPLQITAVGALMSLLAYVVVNGYFLNATGQSLGKKMVGIRIVSLDDSNPGLGKLLLLRIAPISLAALIPVVGQVVSMLDALFIFSRQRRCLHDLLAGTKVVRAVAATAA
jgi:uncharacterized RDD family membrane protein YckC